MQNTAKVNDILQKVSHLTLDEQDFIVQTVNKRIHESRRDEIAKRGKEAERNYHKGNITTGTVNDLMKIVNND